MQKLSSALHPLHVPQINVYGKPLNKKDILMISKFQHTETSMRNKKCEIP